ncbi:MAG: DUF4097 family beta strand repeat protein [Acidobacteria bacterium]|nr:DUF4097 family beta strand repeat protein [Acidobacteriota bacterium]
MSQLHLQASLRGLSRAVLVAGCVVALPACEVNLNTEGLTSTETKTFAVTGQPDLTLETFDGSIEVHAWDRNEVEVTIEKRAMDQALIEQMKVEAEQQGDRIVVRVTGPAEREFSGVTVGVHISPAARLRVAVPRKLALQARTEDGSIRAENLEGRVVLRTGDGSVTTDRLAGEIEIRTGDGAIRMEQAEGRLSLETNDGSITVSAKPTVLRARTGDGPIRLQVEPDAAMVEPWDLTTSDGSITITLPPAFNAEIDAETSDGSVRSSHPALRLDRDDEGRRERRRELRTRMGEGGPVLRIRTGDGSIRFES